MSGRKALAIVIAACVLVIVAYLAAQWLGCLPEPHANRITIGDVFGLVILIAATIAMLVLLKKH